MIRILYRECRFQTALEIFKEVKPDISKSLLFNILGGITNSLYIDRMDKLEFYILSGGTERLRLEYFFKYYDIVYQKVKIKKFLREDKDFENNFYILPIMSTMIKKEKFVDEDKNFLGCSYALVKGYSENENKLFFDFENYKADKCDWIDTKELVKLNDFKSRLIGEYCVYKIEKKMIRVNKCMNYYCNSELKDLVIKNAENFIYGTGDALIFNSMNGKKVYANLINHFEGLSKILKNRNNYKNYSQLIRYYRIQIIYLRNLLLAGTDTFYRGEFIETIKDLDNRYDKFDKDLYIENWSKCSKIWRKIGRLLINMYNDLQEEKVDMLINYFTILRNVEVSSMKLMLESLQEI